MSRLYLNNHDYESAEPVLITTENLINNFPTPAYHLMLLENLTELYLGLKIFDKSMHYIGLRDSANVSLHGNQAIFDISESYKKLQKQKTEADLSMLKAEIELAELKNQRDRAIMWYGGLAFFITLMFFGITYKNMRKIQVLNKSIKVRAEELEALNLFKNRALSIISHDMRTPLASVILFLMAKKSGMSFTEEEEATMNQKLLSNSQSGILVLDNLLKWANSQIKGEQISIERVNCKMLIEPVLNQISAIAANKKVRISIEFGNVELQTNQALYQIVIRNIINNAVKFSPSETTIEIKTWVENERFIFSMIDEGPGIPAETMKMLNNNEQGIKSSSGSDGEQGSGLGLTLCRDFAKNIGGTLFFDNEKDKGAKVLFSIPF